MKLPLRIKQQEANFATPVVISRFRKILSSKQVGEDHLVFGRLLLCLRASRLNHLARPVPEDDAATHGFSR